MKRLVALIMLIMLFAVSVSAGCVPLPPTDTSNGAVSSAVSDAVSGSETSPEESFEEPSLGAVSTAVIGSSGDILIHNGVRKSAYVSETGEYDFSYCFEYLSDYVRSVDYSVVNIEFSVSADGSYASLPFRVPASVVKALAETGYDLGITANNHIQDGGITGIKKTINTLTEFGMDHTGTVLDSSEDRYLVKDINGIKIGFVNYSYGGYWNTNCFSTDNLEAFYADIAGLISDMRGDGAELIYLYIHWGAEYSLSQNTTQDEIAMKMCELGVDVIIGGHPHKVQPVELIESANGNTAICLYSTGNLLSGQQIECMAGGTRANSPNCFQDSWHFAGCDWPDVADRTQDTHRLEHGVNCNDNGHTEDGVLFYTTVTRYEDGTVMVSSVDVLPVWCMGRGLVRASYPTNSYFEEYILVPLDTTIDWRETFGLTDAEYTEAQYSYDRTEAQLSEGINEINDYLTGVYEALNEKYLSK